MIICGINVNDNVIPLSWALVPTENKEWWTWFLAFVSVNFVIMNKKDCIFISDRDKGITAAILS